MLQFNFTPFPVVETENLYLRQISLEDAQEVFDIRSSPETMKYIPKPLAKTLDDAISFINDVNESIGRNELLNWAIASKTENELLGMIGFFRMQPENFRGEVGYVLDPKHHGRGIMKEALNAALKYGFEELRFHSIEAVIDPRNIASERLLQKVDFIKEAHFRENFFYGGEFLDSVIYSKLSKQ